MTQSLQMSRLILSLLLLLVLFCPVQGQEFRLQTEAKPTRQEVFLKVDAGAEGFSGRTMIALELPAGAPPIEFHALDITVDQAILKTENDAIELKIAKRENAILVATPLRALEAGSYSLEMEFSGPFNRRSVGLYKYFDQGLPYLSTQFEMTDARRCFPCFDEPAYKIPFQLTVQSPTDQKVYSNTPELRRSEKDGWTTHEFDITPPLPTYLVALAVGPYEDTPVEGLSVPGRIVAPKGQLERSRYSRKQTPPLLDALEDYFGIPYVYQKLDQVAVSEFPFGAMENAGMITYRADALLIDEIRVTTSKKLGTTGVIAHELAHQWFGNLVTMKWWDDLWLNEAFATWIGTKVVSRLYPELEADLFPAQNWVMESDSHLTTKPIRKPIRNENDIMDGLGLAYNKGGAALNMVEQWIGEDTFRKGVQAYLHNHRFANAEAADLWNALSEVSGKDVKAVLENFTGQAGYPLISLSLEGKTLQISQRRYFSRGVEGPEQVWTLPLFLRYGKGEREHRQTVLLEGTSGTVELAFEPDWLLPDSQGIGYFRWALSEAELESLMINRVRMSSREKIATLYNLAALEQAGSLSVYRRLTFNNLFLSDEHPAVVATSLAFLNDAGELYVTQKNRDAWRKALGVALEPVSRRFGLSPQAGEHPKVQELRALLLLLLAEELGDKDVLAEAREQAERYIQGGESIHPTLTTTYLHIAAHQAEAEMVERVKTAMMKAEDADRRGKLMRALGAFARPQAQAAALELLLDESVTAADLRYLLEFNANEEERRERLQAWVEKNFVALRAKIPPIFLSYIPSSSARAQNKEGLARALDFYRRQEDPQGILARELAKIEEQTLTEIRTREWGEASFEAYLKSVE